MKAGLVCIRTVGVVGRCAGSGIYDIGLDTEATTPTWTLLRVQD